MKSMAKQIQGEELSIGGELELLTNEIKKVTMPRLNSDKPYQSKIISENELVIYVEDGWEIVRELSDKRFLMKKPNHILFNEI